MIPKVCNFLCWGVPESSPSKLSREESEPQILYTKQDIDNFEKYLKKKKGINFLQRFFNYKKKCKDPVLHTENMMYKVALLEHFIACKEYLDDISSLSSNGVRGYLLVDSRIKNKEEIAKLLDFCQKRALFMIEFKPFRNFLKNYPIMREKTLGKKLKVMRKIKKKLKIFNIDFFSFRNDSDATNIILDYRLIFYTKLAKFCVSYFTLVCAYCYVAKPVQLYEIFNDFREIKNTVEDINTKFFMLMSNKAFEQISPVEIDGDMILAMEQLYVEMGKKAAGEFNEDAVNSIYQRVIDIGLSVVKNYKILSDRHHFTGLETFLLERVTGKSRLEKLALNRKRNYSPKKQNKKSFARGSKRRPMNKEDVVEMMEKNIRRAKEGRYSKRRKRFEEKRRMMNSSSSDGDEINWSRDISYDDQELEEIMKENDSEYKDEDSIRLLSTIREVSDYSGTIFNTDRKNSEMAKKNSEEQEE